MSSMQMHRYLQIGNLPVNVRALVEISCLLPLERKIPHLGSNIAEKIHFKTLIKFFAYWAAIW